jgi:hypothetical protein
MEWLEQAGVDIFGLHSCKLHIILANTNLAIPLRHLKEQSGKKRNKERKKKRKREGTSNWTMK